LRRQALIGLAPPRHACAEGQWFHGLGAQAAAFHSQFAQALTAGAASYASTEAQAASTLLTGIIGSPPVSPSSTGNPTVGGKQPGNRS